MNSLLEFIGFISLSVLVILLLAYIIDAIKDYHKIRVIFDEGHLMQRITKLEEDDHQHNEDISYLYTLIEADEPEESES